MFTLSDLTKARQSTYTYEDIERYATQIMEGDTNGIPLDFDQFVSDKAPRNKAELALWIYVCLTRNNLVGHFSPKVNPKQPQHKCHLDFINDAFFELVQDCIVLGNRKGAKTLVFATLLLLESLFKPGIELAHLGAIKDQAHRCYRYFLKMLKHPLFSNNLAKTPTATRTELKNGSVVEILVGTITGVNSPHPVKTQLDEVELMDWNVLQEALNMASSSGPYTGATRLTSTRKYSTGTMQQILDEATAKGFTVYQWNIWDTIEPCRIPQGVESIKVTKEEEDGTHTTHYVCKECLNCELLQACAGKARYSHGGIIPLKDAIRNFKNLDKETWNAQVECNRPGTSDLIFPMFNVAVHVVNYEALLKRRGLWESDTANRTEFGTCFNPAIEVLAGQDAGYNCPAAVFGQMLDEETVVIFDEVYEHNIAPSILITDHLAPRDHIYSVQQWCCDPSGLQLIAEMELQGLLPIQANNDVQNGIDLLRSLLATRRLYIADTCVNLIQELRKYKKTKVGKVAPNQEDHAVDALRYLLMEMGLFTGIVDEVLTGVGS